MTVSANSPNPAVDDVTVRKAKRHKSTPASVSPPPANVGVTVGANPPNPGAANVSVTKVDSVPAQPKQPKRCRSKQASVSPAAANVIVKTEPDVCNKINKSGAVEKPEKVCETDEKSDAMEPKQTESEIEAQE